MTTVTAARVDEQMRPVAAKSRRVHARCLAWGVDLRVKRRPKVLEKDGSSQMRGSMRQAPQPLKLQE